MYPHITVLHLHYLLGVFGAYTLPLPHFNCCLTRACYFAYKTAHVFSRGAHQLQPSDFYNLALTLTLTLTLSR
jgi:hypothetical protein